MPVIPALRRQSQEDLEFEANLHYLSQNEKRKRKNSKQQQQQQKNTN
jgi:hypothetical protein